MVPMPILQHPDPRLRQACTPVGPVTEAVRLLADRMLATMYAANGRGLAAPQVGVLSRLFVMDTGWKDGVPQPVVLIDPMIEWASDRQVVRTERCLSIPEAPRTLARPDAVRMSWTGADGKAAGRTFTGFAATCVQHEFDHLEGKLILDHPEASEPPVLP